MLETFGELGTPGNRGYDSFWGLMPARYEPVLVCLSRLLRAEDTFPETAISQIRKSAGNRRNTLAFICSSIDKKDWSKDPLITNVIGLLHIAAETKEAMPVLTSADLELIAEERSLLNVEEGEAFARLVARNRELQKVERLVQDSAWVQENTVSLSQMPEFSPSSKTMFLLYRLTIGRQVKKARKSDHRSSPEETSFRTMRSQAMVSIYPTITRLVGPEAVGADRLLKTTIAERLVRSYLFHNVANPNGDSPQHDKSSGGDGGLPY